MAARAWASALKARDPAVEFVRCIGSCARGDYGVGSDIDLVIVLSESDLPWMDRYQRYAPDGLPVPADVWVYTRREWDALPESWPALWRRWQSEMIDLLAAA